MDGCVAIAGFATSARLSVRAAVATEEMGGEAEEEVRQWMLACAPKFTSQLHALCVAVAVHEAVV